jgi:transposase
VQAVAESLYIHPFMLSRWRKQAREGMIVTKGVQVDKDVAAELKALRKLKIEHERLKIEHELSKKPSSSLPDEERDLRLHRARLGAVGAVLGAIDVPPCSQCEWLLRLARASAE